MEPKKIIILINICAAILLVISVFNLPYGYYTFLRLFITAVGIINAYYAYINKSYFVLLSGTIIAILFNPLMPIYLQKDAWVVLDVFSAIILFINIFIIRKAISTR